MIHLTKNYTTVKVKQTHQTKENMSLENKITEVAKSCVGFVRAGVGMEHESGFWDNVFECESGWLRVVFDNQTSYAAFEAKLLAAMPDEPEIKRQTKPINPEKFSWNKKPRDKQERIIAENHKADVENGMSESDAYASDQFERRVLGLD